MELTTPFCVVSHKDGDVMPGEVLRQKGAAKRWLDGASSPWIPEAMDVAAAAATSEVMDVDIDLAAATATVKRAPQREGEEHGAAGVTGSALAELLIVGAQVKPGTRGWKEPMKLTGGRIKILQIVGGVVSEGGRGGGRFSPEGLDQLPSGITLLPLATTAFLDPVTAAVGLTGSRVGSGRIHG